jgi:hypothetical protein
MSRQAHITLTLRRRAGVRRVDLLPVLFAHGWTPAVESVVSYVRLGDEDSFDYHERPLADWPQIFDELVDKDLAGETIALVIAWRDTGVGGHLFLFRDGSLCLMANVGRRNIGESRDTDFAWYVPKLVDAFASFDAAAVESVVTDEFD